MLLRKKRAARDIMIRRIRVHGFRSLLDFDLTLTPGVNLLVGPNGSGKTNITAFLEFLSAFVMRGPSAAIASAGGSAALFSRETRSTTAATMSFEVRGAAKLYNMYEGKWRGYIAYAYSASIQWLQEAGTIVITEETLTFGTPARTEAGAAKNEDKKSLYIHISRDVEALDRGPALTVRRFGAETPTEGARRSRLSQGQLQNTLNAELKSAPPYQSLFEAPIYSSDLMSVRSDLFQGAAFNVAPEKAKQADDFATEYGVKRDGAGLTTTLHHMQQAMHGSGRRRNYYGHPNPEVIKGAFAQILELLRLVNPSILSIKVTPSFDLGKYITYLQIDAPNPIEIPLSSASDGTVKWLALCAALLSGTRVMTIEEPENFLHPKMQQRFVQLIRDLSSQEQASCFLLTTHSETLVDCARAQEVVIVQFEDGRTVAHRVPNQDELEAEVEATGFGLGQYYVAGAFE